MYMHVWYDCCLSDETKCVEHHRCQCNPASSSHLQFTYIQIK
jgi:hypothetical protein